ncbi:MAG: hypothetical protein NTW12_07750 [Deltaproteobacteria bacterium]|nr:hypothetical protein [Deltaproteobacteria bacterium]
MGVSPIEGEGVLSFFHPKLHLLYQRKQWPIGDYEEDAVLIFGYLEGAVDVSGRGIEKHTFACLLAGLSIDQRALHD